MLFTILKPFISLIGLTNGWKTVIGWLVAEVGTYLSTGNPLVVGAVEKAVTDPTAANITVAAGQVLVAAGIIHRTKKNVKGEN